MSDDHSMQKPAQLRDVLSSLIRRKGLVETSATEQLNAAWKQAAGPEIGSRSSVRKLRQGVLEVVVTNNVVLEQLRSYLHHSILQQLQSSLPESGIRSIRYVRRRP